MNHGHVTALNYLRIRNDDDKGNIDPKNRHPMATETDLRHHIGNFGIPDVAYRTLVSLSAGQRVRLWLARQQFQHQRRPTLLILDETSENLDVETKQSLLEVLNTFVGATIVVSHDDNLCTHFQPTQTWTIVQHDMTSAGGLRVEYPS